MVKYPHHKAVELGVELVKYLGLVCGKYWINESEYICTSPKNDLHTDIWNNQKKKEVGSVVI
tara:strand:+ start:123 stop:308 length:186 start_codon:yes stop_codon:yes gene_type:complete